MLISNYLYAESNFVVNLYPVGRSKNSSGRKARLTPCNIGLRTWGRSGATAGAKGGWNATCHRGHPILSWLVGNGPADSDSGDAHTPGFEHRAGHARGNSEMEFAPRRVPPLMRAARLRYIIKCYYMLKWLTRDLITYVFDFKPCSIDYPSRSIDIPIFLWILFSI